MINVSSNANEQYAIVNHGGGRFVLFLFGFDIESISAGTAKIELNHIYPFATLHETFFLFLFLFPFSFFLSLFSFSFLLVELLSLSLLHSFQVKDCGVCARAIKRE